MNAVDDDRPGDADRAPGHAPPRLTVCFGLMGLIWVLLVVASWLMEAFAGSWLLTAGAVVVAAALATIAWEFRGQVMRTMTSVPFSVAQLVVFMLLTAIGTLIIQQSPPAAYDQRYGETMAWILLSLGMDDLFHASWFSGLLALMAVSLVLTAIRKRAWRPPMWGHLLSHLGFVTVLLGGWIGSTWGFKGIIDLHEGRTADQFTLLGAGGARGESRPLGFALKLERFAIEHYEAEPKFYVYERAGDEFRVADVLNLDEVESMRSIGSSGATIRMDAVYPDFILRPEIRPVPPGTGRPVLQIDFKQGDWSARAALQAGVSGKDTAPLSADGPLIHFRWTEPDEGELGDVAGSAPEQHVLVLRSAHGAEEETIAVTVGETHRLPESAYLVEVLRFLPDFNYDTAAKQARTRSQEPNNPALLVRITDPTSGEEWQRWLYDKMPDFAHDAHTAGPRFIYRYRPPEDRPARELMVIGETEEIWRLEQDQVAERLPLDRWPSLCSGLPVAGMQVHASAEIEMVPDSMSDEWDNPVADIVVEEGDTTRRVRIATGHEQPLTVADGTTFIAFEMRTDEPKAFRSHLTVLEDGVAVADKTIVVNDPLSYQGRMFYQSNFRKDDPTYSGIKVVYDPGLLIAIAGMVMMSLGVPFVYYVRPRLVRNETNGS